MTPLLQQGLPKAGVIHTFPRALVHGPLQYGGLDIPNLFTEQVIAHIHTILRYGPEKSDPMGHLLHTTGKAMRLEVGYSGELLMAPLVTNSWIKHVWVSTQESGVTILMDFAEVPLQRHGDIELMRLFVKNGWQQPELQILNQCRLYLKVFLLSEIICGVGTTIAVQFWEHFQSSDSSLEWPVTHAPPEYARTLWRQALSTSLHLGQNHRLATPLGKWHAPTHPKGWYYHSPMLLLWKVMTGTWTQHGGLPQRMRQTGFHGTGEEARPPPINELEKATITHWETKIILTGRGRCDTITQGIDPCQRMRTMEFAQQWALETHLTGAQRKLQEALLQGHGYAVSDGSFKDRNGAAAWIIKGTDSMTRLSSQWYTPGHADDHSSFHSKLAGIVGVLYTLTFWPPKEIQPTL